MEQEGSSFPGKSYAELVLSPAFDEAKAQLLGPMMAINKAHLIMLVKQNLVTEEQAQVLADAIGKLDLPALRKATYTGEFEDLFYQVEHMLLELAGDLAGNLHLARSRNDMGIAIYRMTLREKLLSAIQGAMYLQDILIATAVEHVDTVMIGYTHTQQAQPTTLAHYLMAAVDMLGRDLRRLVNAYRNCNRSSMGSAALTTTGFAIDREEMMRLLAFDEIIENSYDAIAGADYVSEVAAAVQLTALNLGRMSQDLLLWCTQEFGAIKLSAAYVQVSSIMPQKRNPVSVEHIRSLLSSCVGNTQTVISMLHNTPFGDIVDTEDDMQPYAWKSLALLEQICRLLGNVIGTMEVNKEVLLHRAQESFATVTELADTLVRTEGIYFRQSHHIVSSVVRKTLEKGGTVKDITLEMINEESQRILGRDVTLDQAQLEQALDPVHFVQLRSLTGGPNPQEIRRMANDRRQKLKDIQAWYDDTMKKNESALAYLEDRMISWQTQS